MSLLCIGWHLPVRSGAIVLARWTVQSSASASAAPPRIAPRPDPPGEHSVLRPPSLSSDQIDAILAAWGSPAAGTGAIWVDLGRAYGIDPAYALAFFVHESGAGTHPQWAGRKPDGGTTHNIGNIICAGRTECYGRFRDYPGWKEGIEDWYRLIAIEYVEWRGVYTVETIVPIYAPSHENDVSAYISAVNQLVAEWTSGSASLSQTSP